MSLPAAAMRLACALLLMCLPVRGSLHRGGDLDVSGADVTEQLLHLASFSDDSAPAVTRIVFTPNDLKARAQAPCLSTLQKAHQCPPVEGSNVQGADRLSRAGRYVKELMTEAGLSVREDAVGNIFGLLAGDGSAGPSASLAGTRLKRHQGCSAADMLPALVMLSLG